MALTGGEQAALDRIEGELTRTDPGLATTLASFARPPGPDPADELMENMRARLRSPWTIISVLGAFVLLVLAMVTTPATTGRCVDTSADAVCADTHRSSAADRAASSIGP